MFVRFVIVMVLLVTLYFVHLNTIAVVGIICLVLTFFGYGLFEANMIQYKNTVYFTLKEKKMDWKACLD